MVRFQKTLIFPTDVNDFIQLLGHLGATVGGILVEIMEDTGRKLKNGSQKLHVDVESGYVGGCDGTSWPKLAALVRSNSKKCSLPRQGA